MGPDVVQVAEPHEGHPDEPAVLAEHHVEQALEDVGLEQHVVVEEQRVRRRGLVEQVLALLGEPAPGQVPVRLDVAAAGPQESQGREHLGRGAGAVRQVGSLGLVADDDAERLEGLGGETGQGHRERGGPVAGRHQDVEERAAAGGTRALEGVTRHASGRHHVVARDRRHADRVPPDALDDRRRRTVLRVGKDPHLPAVRLDQRGLRASPRAPGRPPSRRRRGAGARPGRPAVGSSNVTRWSTQLERREHLRPGRRGWSPGGPAP